MATAKPDVGPPAALPTSGSRLDAAASVALICICFAPAYGLYRFHDDWLFVSEAASAISEHRVTSFVFHPLAQHWTPAWHAIEVFNFIVAGWEADWFIRSLIATCTLLSLLLCASILRTLGLSTVGRLLGITTLALHHTAAVARFSFDTYSQSLVDLLGWTAVVCAIRALLSDHGITVATVVRVVALLTPALFVKEQALAAFAGVALVIACAAWWRRDVLSSRPVVWLLLIVAAEAAFFAAVRRAMGVAFAEEGEAFSLCPRCVPVNIVELGSATLLPVRTLVFFDAVRAMPIDRWKLVTIMVGAVGVAAAILAGVRQRIQQAATGARELALVAGAFVASYFPVALLGHVGEFYTHTTLFWFAVLVACAGDALWRATAGRTRAAVAVCATVYLASLGVGQHANLRDMRANGERARGWLALIADRVRAVPDGGIVVVRASGPYKARFDYGLYRLTTPQALVLGFFSPPSLLYAVGDRLEVVLDEALASPSWRDRVAEAAARRAAYWLDLDAGEARLSPLTHVRP
jgi:hypothetical protein